MTISRAEAPIIRSGFPRGGSLSGLQKRREFIADKLSILGDAALLFVPIGTDTTSSTGVDRNGRVITWDATIAGRYSTQGSGLLVDFDGAANDGDTPDVDALSFGDSQYDFPFSVGGLFVPDVNNALMTLLAKGGAATTEEWELFLDASGHPNFRLADESATAFLEGRYAVAAGTSVVTIDATYSGSRLVGGISLYTNGVSRTVTNDSSGAYVAMENSTGLMHVGARFATKEQFFNGRIGYAYVTPRMLTAAEIAESYHQDVAYYAL